MNRFFICCCLLNLIISCQSKAPQVKFDQPVASLGELEAHSKEFEKPEVIKVTDHVYVAVGFGLANSILIEGENGNIIVDCLESDGVAKQVKAAFSKINNKPVKAIIYTHNHADHIFGSGVMAGDDDPEIYAHELTNYYIDRLVSVVQPIISMRSFRMFGIFLDEQSHINCGIGPQLDGDENVERSLRRPTKTFTDSLDLEIEGIKIKLVHAPGETNDQLFVWLPDQQVLLPGDNIYKTFPNLYTIRGTPYRDVKGWVNSLDKMRHLKAKYLVPSHTRPITDEEEIEKVLRDYRDGIQFVHDQTVRQMNLGKTPDEIVEIVKLPIHLSSSPFLKEFYGRVDWSVRAIYNGYLGHFDGNATTLIPLSKIDKAEKMAALAGGEKDLLAKAKSALGNKEYQWALELADYLLVLDLENENAKDIRFQCLQALGENQSNPNARNYYLSQALEMKGQVNDGEVPRPPAIVHTIPLASIFQAISVYLKAEDCLEFDQKAVFYFTDEKCYWSIHIRNGVAEVQPFAMENPDLEITTTAVIWKEIAAEIRSPTLAVASRKVKVKGGLNKFKKFMNLFLPE